MKRILLLFLSIALLLPSFVYGESMATREWVVDMGYFGVGGLNLEQKMNRAELATLTIRLLGLEEEARKYTGKSSFEDVDDFQGGWAVPFIHLAQEKGLISGTSKKTFNPGGNVSYIELLTVFMRVLGYRDGTDLTNFPKDYHKKALEIGLADLYGSLDEEVLRETVLSVMVKTLNTNLKNENYSLYEFIRTKAQKNESQEKAEEFITMTNLKFNTTISGVFSGILSGSKDFTGYKVALLSQNGDLYESTILGKSGSFSISSFDISYLARLNGYRYEVFNKEGLLILKSKLQ